MANLLIVDDEKGYRDVLSVVLGAEGYNVSTAEHGCAALTHIKKSPVDVIVSDVRMPDMDGIELLKRVKEVDPETGIVMMTAFGTIETAREAFRLGADDFVQKPFNNDELKVIIRRALDRRALLTENRAYKEAQRANLTLMLGTSSQMAELSTMIERVAKERSTILITGESGTGKELVARSIHELSERSNAPFVPVNCGAVAEGLLESELFGFMKGSFTGAGQNRAGVFEAANTGSIFLDEIGEMPLSMQVKMLRVLQDGKVRRIGSAQEIDIDARVIAATNRDLNTMLEEGSFRQDLFYRLSVIPIHVPPLRERLEDIPILARHFVKRFSLRSGKSISVSETALASLADRQWPGNVRELEHTMERAVALTRSGEEIHLDGLAAGMKSWSANPTELPGDGLDLKEHMERIEKGMIEEALRRANGNRTKAAALLRMEPYQLRHLQSKHGL